MGRIKIIGEEKCPQIDRKTGKQDCPKLGRPNPRLMISWNNRRRFDKQRMRKYPQFIHNDGSRHNITMEEVDHPNNFKGHPNEQVLKALHEKTIIQKKLARRFRRMATASLTWPLKPEEREYIRAQYKAGNFEPLLDTHNKYEKLRRRKVYKQSQILKDKPYNNPQTFEFEEIDKLARERLPLQRESLEKDMDELLLEFGPDKTGQVISRMCNLIMAQKRELGYEEQSLKEYLQTDTPAKSNLT